MKFDIKCFFGLHHYKLIETKELKNPYSITIGTVYVLQCINCGKIKEKVVYTDTDYVRE